MPTYQLTGRFCQSGGHCESVSGTFPDYSSAQNMLDSAFRTYAGWIIDVYPSIAEIPDVVMQPIPETPPPSELPNIDLKVLRINLDYAILSRLPIQSLWEKLEYVLNPLGWYVPLVVTEGNQLIIYLGERGSITLGTALVLVIGVLALFGLISFSWSVIEREQTIQEAEETEQTLLEALYKIAGDYTLPLDVRMDAANKILELESVVTLPPVLPPSSIIPPLIKGGISGALLALAAVYLLSKKK